MSVIAALITVLLLAGMGAGMAYFSASNQQASIQQVTTDQAFYTTQAGLDFSIGQILEDESSETSFVRQFSGETFTSTRTSGLVTVSAAEKDAVVTHSINDPDPASIDCLEADITGAAITSNINLTGITLNRKAGCADPVTITSMTGTAWTPDLGELLSLINIGGGGSEFSSPDAGSGGTFDFGSKDYTIDDALSHSLLMTWDSSVVEHNFELHFNYTYGVTPISKIVNVVLSSEANCFAWNTGSARLTSSGGIWDQLTGTTVTNSCAYVITLDKMTVSWSPTTPTSNLTAVQIDGSSIYSGSAGSGAEIDVADTYPATTTQDVNYLDFDVEMLGRDYTIAWTFSDASIKNTTLDLFAGNQHDCLTIDTSGVAIDPGNAKRFTGLTIQNTCGADIGMTDITMTWTGELTRRFTESSIDDTDGANIYTSNAASGVAVSFGDNDLYLRNEDGVKDINYIEFNNDITASLEFTLTFTMVDGNTKAVTFSGASEAGCLTVNTAGANITGGADKQLQGIILTNACGSNITWAQTVVSWTPLTPSRTIKKISVAGGSTEWAGTADSGDTLDIVDRTITAFLSQPIDYFAFSKDMSGYTFTIQFIMFDGSSTTTPPFTPPDGP